MRLVRGTPYRVRTAVSVNPYFPPAREELPKKGLVLGTETNVPGSDGCFCNPWGFACALGELPRLPVLLGTWWSSEAHAAVGAGSFDACDRASREALSEDVGGERWLAEVFAERLICLP